MGMKVAIDNGRGRNESILTWGRGNDQYLITRNHPVTPGQSPDPNPKPVVDHISFTIANWDKNAVEVQFNCRGLNPRPDTDDSFIIKDPDGFTLQIQGPGLNAVNSVYTKKRLDDRSQAYGSDGSMRTMADCVRRASAQAWWLWFLSIATMGTAGGVVAQRKQLHPT